MNGLLAKLGLSRGSGRSDAKRVLDQIIDEIVEARRAQNAHWEGIKSLKDSPRWNALMDEPAEHQLRVALAALTENKRGMGGTGGWDFWLRRDLPFAAARLILQKKSLAIPEDILRDLVSAAARTRHLEYQFPVSTILGACERHLNGAAATGEVKSALEAFVRRIEKQRHATQALQKMGLRARAMLEPAKAGTAATLPAGAFAESLGDWVGADPARIALADHLTTAFDKSKPAKAWLAKGATLADATPGASDQLRHWLETVVPDPEHPDLSLELLKALIWLAPPRLAPHVGRFCVVCYRKVPNIGARSVKLGNACLFALENMDDPAAIAEVSRLSREIKYPSVRDQIAKRLTRLAEAAGVSVADLEDRALPSFGLSVEGSSETALGDYVATLRIDAMDSALTWRNADGKALKSVPKAVRDDHADALAELKSRKKAIDDARKAVVARLEAGWIDGLSWALADWEKLYRDHPVRRAVTEALIWQITDASTGVAFLPHGQGGIAPDGSTVDLPANGRVSLWHPLDSDPASVLAWRRCILSRAITQPIKQAHREIYVLTDAERQTEVYSNRFAAHILRQHQFRALCEDRGWKYSLMGAHFDSANTPSRALPTRNLVAEYTVSLVDDGQESDTGIATHIATDQVSFLNEDFERVPLVDVPPIVFSEVMRDVDLFVAVASVANDPGWTDGGPEGRFGGYWRQHAFGDLSQTAETRKQVLEDILPALAISDRCRIDGKFLVVSGKRQDYAIHLGSSNIQIRPSNRYLCIVPGRSKHGTAHLPFAGDGTLSIILSKAYLLVDDDKITDKSILAQL